jgi:hypothetical protein
VAGRGSREEGRWGCWPGERDLEEVRLETRKTKEVGTDLLFEPYRPARHRAESWGRRVGGAEGSPGKRASEWAEGSTRTLAEECWRTKYWRVEPRAAACTSRRVGRSEQGQQQKFGLQVGVQKVRR